jgi:type II secretory pathway component GspD/PulD (secretin)
MPAKVAPIAKASTPEPNSPISKTEHAPGGKEVSQQRPTANDSNSIPPQRAETTVNLANADEVVQLNLPGQLDMAQLLDLVGEYLQLDFLYDPAKIKGQVVTLRLHGKLQGKVRVKDLYALLESVVKFKGFAMVCHEGCLVTIVPVADALQVNPDLVDSRRRTVDAGDMVVTSVFELQNLDASNASTLLQNMKLSLAATVVEGSRTLIVTCYAHEVDRIEQLLSVVDKPGPIRQFKFRQLNYTMAGSLAEKVRQLSSQMQNVSISIGSVQTTASATDKPTPPPVSAGRISRRPSGAGSGASDSVYLDADERTNRILMVGYAEQLGLVNNLIEALDVAQQDLRVLKVYDVRHVEAEEIRKKLQELEIVGAGTRRMSSGPPGAKAPAAAEIVEGTLAEAPTVVVLEATNSLVINATEEQHARIEAMMDYLDAEVRTETIPYEIYFLENQSPEDLTQTIEKIIHETVQDKDGKVQKIVRDTDEQIKIVPDKGTFSLIVYASRKNQDWINRLIKTLDKARPQVLIDVTLVEIRKSDEFSYDLNLITSAPDLTETGGQTGSFKTDDQTVVRKLLSAKRSQFADAQVNAGNATGFYADVHVNALLTAIQKKNYGRVLAKPKVLVNDNTMGTIKTADTTYVIKKTSIPVTSGSAGQQNTLIETAIDYQPYNAGITLEITPHISDGELLRLEINLTRSDFTMITGEKPPDQTSSDIKTVVTVPDGSTIILGGMLRLNQSKGGNKVPILGDLPIIGLPFRSLSNSDIQSKLYIFVKAEVIRPSDAQSGTGRNLNRLSDQDRQAFEQHESEFQNYEDWPGVESQPIEPAEVLEAR